MKRRVETRVDVKVESPVELTPEDKEQIRNSLRGTKIKDLMLSKKGGIIQVEEKGETEHETEYEVDSEVV